MTAVFTCLLLILGTTAGAQTATSPDAQQLLQQGEESFRAGRYADAVESLRSAAAGFLTAEQKQEYIETGKLKTLPQLEESLVYLALAYDKLGREADARDAVGRLMNAERIAPTYAALPLRSDAAGFEALASKLFPSSSLPPNIQLASGGVAAPTPVETAAAPQPAVVTPVAAAPAPAATPAPAVAQAPAPATVPVAAAQAQLQAEQPKPTAPEAAAAPAIAAAPSPATPIAEAKPVAEPPAKPAAVQASASKKTTKKPTTPPPAKVAAAQPTAEEQRAEMLKLVDEKVAEARAKIEKEADARVAEVQREADARIAREKKAADQAAQEQIARDRAAAQKAADEKIAKERASIEKAAQEQIAREREIARKAAEERIAAEQAGADRAAREARDAAEAETRREMLGRLAEAGSMAADGRLDEANRIYINVANSPAASREAVAAAATGLYRTGDYANAAAAFTRLGTFARGEEDLRYYAAVSLYETGRYEEARRQLACALPFIEVTPDVVRYRDRIRLSAAASAAR